ETTIVKIVMSNPTYTYFHFRQEGCLRGSLAVPDRRGTTLCFSEDHGATRNAMAETGDFTRSRYSASPNRRLTILTAAARVRRARHFPPPSRVGRRIDAKEMKSIKMVDRARRSELGSILDSIGQYPDRLWP